MMNEVDPLSFLIYIKKPSIQLKPTGRVGFVSIDKNSTLH
jgi:hypothetical protein